MSSNINIDKLKKYIAKGVNINGVDEKGRNYLFFFASKKNFNEEAAHICSTIEMLDFDLEVDVAIIDEVQMLEDIDRGWAWVNAIIGVPAKKVIMTGSVNALEAVKKIVQYLDEELEVVRHKRKNELRVLPKWTPLDKLENGTALIAFSRAEVLKLKQKLQKKYSGF